MYEDSNAHKLQQDDQSNPCVIKSLIIRSGPIRAGTNKGNSRTHELAPLAGQIAPPTAVVHQAPPTA